MVCPYCAHKDTSVINSRPSKSDSKVWRRRHCRACNTTITTYETVSERDLPPVHHAGTPSPFSLPRLMVSIHRSLLPRPDAPESAQALAETIMQRLLNTHSHTLTTRHIAVTTRDALHHFDKTAALRYALDRGLITP